MPIETVDRKVQEEQIVLSSYKEGGYQPNFRFSVQEGDTGPMIRVRGWVRRYGESKGRLEQIFWLTPKQVREFAKDLTKIADEAEKKA